ncbi:MAG: hypothetical protein B7Y05_06570 [Polynucleobacter sp. 24-46-87]|jgi:hypothetical protein|nr:MAG: hypothetical protein B7Y55_00665 [Polynucleobacter sp. 35-46-207]OZA14696.1 MAG: hypothetical protein B7Y05_06570 [Polynucleobacter sp. 24-46-87]OZB49093.1 MAG: hypothetical protein B7X60_02235 [Polynucleobacter sp. 39-45-136]
MKKILFSRLVLPTILLFQLSSIALAQNKQIQQYNGDIQANLQSIQEQKAKSSSDTWQKIESNNNLPSLSPRSSTTTTETMAPTPSLVDSITGKAALNNPNNWNTSPNNYNATNGVYDSQRNRQGYQTQTPSGVLDHFDNNGNRIGYAPK